MAWTAPRTWTTSELVTSSIANIHWRDNQLAQGEGNWQHNIQAAHLGFSTVGFTSDASAGKAESTNQNDEIVFRFPMVNGTWKLSLRHVRGSTFGIYTVYFDAASVGTIDGYSAGGDTTVSTITGISVAKNGAYTALKLKLETKNASSSGYAAQFYSLALIRTA